MNRLIRHLAFVAIFLHSGCGCCWHHVHGDALASGKTDRPAVACCGHDRGMLEAQVAHWHDGDRSSSASTAWSSADHADHSHSEPQPGTCDGPQCDFIPPRVNELFDLSPDRGFDVPLVANRATSDRFSSGRTLARLATREQSAGPLRLHLLEQVFLL